MTIESGAALPVHVRPLRGGTVAAQGLPTLAVAAPRCRCRPARALPGLPGTPSPTRSQRDARRWRHAGLAPRLPYCRDQICGEFHHDLPDLGRQPFQAGCWWLKQIQLSRAFLHDALRRHRDCPLLLRRAICADPATPASRAPGYRQLCEAEPLAPSSTVGRNYGSHQATPPRFGCHRRTRTVVRA